MLFISKPLSEFGSARGVIIPLPTHSSLDTIISPLALWEVILLGKNSVFVILEAGAWVSIGCRKLAPSTTFFHFHSFWLGLTTIKKMVGGEEEFTIITR